MMVCFIAEISLAVKRSYSRYDTSTHLSDKKHSCVKVFWMPLARWVEELLPGAEVSQSHATVTGDLWPNLLILHHQHLHQHNIH